MRLITIKVMALIICCAFFWSTARSQTDSQRIADGIKKVLQENGYPPNAPFIIKIISSNQVGGQTAFVINNHFIGDTSYKYPDSLNYAFSADSSSGRFGYWVWPRQGKWSMPFVAYPSIYANPDKNASMMSSFWLETSALQTMGLTIYIRVNVSEYECKGGVTNSDCSVGNKMFIPVYYSEGTIVFGDRSEPGKVYIYRMGDITSLSAANSVAVWPKPKLNLSSFIKGLR